MFRQFFCSSFWALQAYSLLVLIIAIWIARSRIDVWSNDWTSRFYDEISAAAAARNGSDTEPTVAERTKLETNWRALMIEYATFTTPYILSWPLLQYATRVFSFQWRQAITVDYLYRWRVLAKGDASLEGISQRIQDDIYRFSRTLDSFAQGLLAALVGTLTFTPILWELSKGLSVYPDGTLVAVAYGSNILGIGVSLIVGAKLVTLEYNNQVVEAAFRKELVYAEDGSPSHGALAVLHRLFWELRLNYFMLFRHFIYFETWQAIFDQGESLVAPLLLAHSVYSGRIAMGRFMQTVQAYGRVNSGLSMLIHRWVEFNELVSVMRRLRELDSILPRCMPADLDDPRTRLRPPAKSEGPMETSPLVGAPAAKGEGWRIFA